MRKIYIPTNEELIKMQDLGVNIYKYLFTKQIETLILRGIETRGILSRCYGYQSNNKAIVHSICYLYPEEINNSKLAQNDTELCKKIINKKNNRDVFALDDLCLFNNVILNDVRIIETAIKGLVKGLDQYPRYRFEYREPNLLLDNIFSGHIVENQNYLLTPEAIKEIIKIDPVYLVKIPDYQITTVTENKDELEELLQNAINSYANRYQVNEQIGYEYTGKDILTNPNKEVKRLVRKIKSNR